MASLFRMPLAAVGQICSTSSMAHNLAQCQGLVQKAATAGAKALFLPEASDYIPSSVDEGKRLVRSIDASPFVAGLRRSAQEHGIAINVGIHEPDVVIASAKAAVAGAGTGGNSEASFHDGRIKNTLVWIDEKGEIQQRYQKLHLFDVDIANGPRLQESKNVEPGNAIIPPFRTPFGRLGLCICFDLRFPELSLSLRRQGAQCLTYPSAFTIPTGKAGHWTTLLRARAIETQSYIFAAAQCGHHNAKRSSYGHSMIVGPWGDVLAELGGMDDSSHQEVGGGSDMAGIAKASANAPEPDIAVAEIDVDLVHKVRSEVSLRRRTDVYPEI